jgi:ArsR family transcriptional regulator
VSYLPIFGQLSALSELIHCRMLLLFERHELTVSELCQVLQLPQSTVSRHLKVLSDARLAASRRDGTSRFYVANLTDGTEATRTLWQAVRQAVAVTPAAEQDAHRLRGVLASRRSKSEAFWPESAREWDRMRDELYGRRFWEPAMFAFLDPDMTVGDLGCGTGRVAAGVAPYVRRVIAVDGSEEMLRATRYRLQEFDNVSSRQGDLEALPIEAGELDAAALVLVLHHLPDPGAALREAARVLAPGGRLVVVDMLPHDREEYKQQMGHVWLGFSREQIEAELREAGFERVRVHPLPAESGVKGPTLFAAAGQRAAVGVELTPVSASGGAEAV